MHHLTLTSEDRKAIDWVGHRYWHGHEFFKLLCECQSEQDWDSPEPITFTIPEHIAWEITTEHQDDEWSCFSEELVDKLNRFCDSVV